MSNPTEILRKFCDGSGLGPFEIDQLKAAGFIAQNPQDKSWFVTTTGHVALQAQPQLPLGDIEHSQHYYDFNRNRPFGEDMTQGPDDDSYLPPKQVLSLTSVLNVQEGGDHYKNLKIQPVEFIEANGIPFLEGCVIKRMCRHGSKAKAKDLRKAIHEITLLLELRYGEKA